MSSASAAEQLFRDQKSRHFQLESNDLSDPQHIDRLLLIVSICLLVSSLQEFAVDLAGQRQAGARLAENPQRPAGCVMGAGFMAAACRRWGVSCGLRLPLLLWPSHRLLPGPTPKFIPAEASGRVPGSDPRS